MRRMGAEETPKTELHEGVLLGPYRVEQLLGSGGMGQVFRAVDTRLQRKVAIKVSSERFSERFRIEARVLSSLNHPAICTLFDVGPDYLVMEYLEGETLEARTRRSPLDTSDIIKYGVSIAEALGEAHAAGVVHRDLKPANIMLTRHGVKVLDFGLARVSLDSDQTRLTQSHAVMGTPAYMAPEQVEGKEADPRADLFSFGLVLYQMCTGRLPFPGASLGSMMLSNASAAVEPPSTVRHGIPRGLDAVVSRLLAKSPVSRFENAAQVRDELLRLSPDSRPVRLRTAVAVAVGVVVVALLVWRPWVPGTADGVGNVTQVRPVTTYPGDERIPVLSPDGSQVAFSWTGLSGNNRDIYVTQIGDQAPLKLTDDPAEDSFPAWSPDGSEIAFLRQHDVSRADIVVVSALGRSERKLQSVLLAGPGFASTPSPSWTPDGKSILYAAPAGSDGTFHLYKLSLESGKALPIALKSAQYGYSVPVLSPNRRGLAYVAFDVGPATGSLMVQELDDSGQPAGDPLMVPGARANPLFPQWRNDHRLVFSSGTQILEWEMDGMPRLVYTANERLTGFSLSTRGGLRAVTAMSSGNSDNWKLPLHAGASGPAGPPVRVAPSSMAESMPRLSPDGKHLAFVSSRSGNPELWVSGPDGENPRQLSHLGASILGYARWSPDGSRIAFHARIPDVADLYVVELDSGVPRRLANGTLPSWTADGQFLYANVSVAELARVRVEDGKTEPLFQAELAVETSDGKSLLYSKSGQPGIYMRSLEGDIRSNPERRMVEDYVVPVGGYVPASDGFFYTSVQPDGKVRSFRFFDFASGRARDIALAPQGVTTGLSVSPDRRSLYYCAVQDNTGTDVWLLEFDRARK